MMARYYHQIRYWNLDANNGWHHVADTGETVTRADNEPSRSFTIIVSLCRQQPRERAGPHDLHDALLRLHAGGRH